MPELDVIREQTTETTPGPEATPAAEIPDTYAHLLRVRGFAALVISSLLSRTAGTMWMVGIVLFVLERYHSPSLAGLSVFALIAPGLATSPIGGALLDRYGRRRLMTADFAVAAVSLGFIVGLSLTNRLPAWLLIAILILGSFTSTLSVAGSRSLFPLTVPRHMWDRANAVDSFSYGPSFVLGPALAGTLTARFGGAIALAVVAVGFLLAAVPLMFVPEPKVGRPVTASVLKDAWSGLVYVVKTNPTLRGLAVSISVANLGWGIAIVALPVLVYQRLHGDAALVGELLALQGVAALPASLVAGRFSTAGKERQIIAASMIVLALTYAALLVPSLLVVALAVAIGGAANAPFDLALFSVRQRRTDVAWFGRAFAVSMALNFSGMPFGSALSGPIINRSLTVAILLAAVVSVLGAVLMMVMVPARGAERQA